MTNIKLSPGRVLLFLVAISVGYLTAYAIQDGIWFATATFMMVGISYTLVASLAVNFCGRLRVLAFPHEELEWSSDTRAALGAFWPGSLLFWLVITPFFAIINRLFSDARLSALTVSVSGWWGAVLSGLVGAFGILLAVFGSAVLYGILQHIHTDSGRSLFSVAQVVFGASAVIFGAAVALWVLRTGLK